MKKNVFFLVFGVVLLSFLTYGCNGRDYNTDPWAIPTFTPVPSPVAGAMVMGISVICSPGATTVSVTIISGSTPVTNAAVSINGQVITHMWSGVYMNTGLTGVTPGTVLNLSVTSPSGNATGTATVPMTTGTNIGTITGADPSSVFQASCS